MTGLLIGIIFLAWCVYSSIEGWREGMYWHYFGLGINHPSYEHKLWTVQRLIVSKIICLLVYLITQNICDTIYFLLSLGLIFIFLHDGFYYESRHKLDKTIYPQGFFDHSDTSTAWLTKYTPMWVRLILCILSISILFYIIKN